MKDLFSSPHKQIEEIQQDIYLLRNFTAYEALIDDVKTVVNSAPFRFMKTPGGKKLNISMTNCGDLGWISEATGYRYSSKDPATKQNWPSMPPSYYKLANAAASKAHFKDFNPNACLINHYKCGRELTAHQDKNEPDLTQPIVSVSLGMSAQFQIYGNSRSNKPLEIELYDGDVMVWGRSARLIYHGVKTKRGIPHKILGVHRINLTMRSV